MTTIRIKNANFSFVKKEERIVSFDESNIIPYAPSTGTTWNVGSYRKSYVLQVVPSSKVRITANENGARLAYLNSFTMPTSAQDIVPYCNGCDSSTPPFIEANNSAVLTLPSDCHYLVVVVCNSSNSSGATDRTPASMTINDNFSFVPPEV